MKKSITLDEMGARILEAARKLSAEDRERISKFELLMGCLRTPVGELK